VSGTIVIGVDGGGSKTRAMVADETGAKIVEVDGPGSAVRPGQHERSADVIAELVRDALAAADMSHVVPKVLCVGVAGVGVEHERQALWQALQGREVAEDVIVHTDAMVALDDAFGEGPGVLLISGTGSIAWGRSPAGTLGRCGGWGPNIGDEGSGQWIGRRALSIVAAASDGREPETALSGAILTAAQVNDVQELIAWAAQATPMQLATLAPAVMSVADAGDLRANSLMTLAAEELMLHVRTLARSLFMDERSAIPVAFAGGLLSRGSTLRKRLELRLKSAVPGATVRVPEVDPARGAVRGALRYLGVELV
jgi:glucosamine kinase